MSNILSTRNEKTLHIKDDARVPYTRVVEVIDAVQESGVEGLTLLAAQEDASDHGKRLVPPKGLEMRVRIASVVDGRMAAGSHAS